MVARHTRITFPIKILNLFHTKNSIFRLFIFLIGLPIGFICSFYLQGFSTAVQTSILSVFHHLPPLPVPDAENLSSLTSLPHTDNLFALTPLPPLLPHVDNLSLLPPPPTLPLANDLSTLTQPPPPLTQPPPPLPHPDNLSSLTTSTPPSLLPITNNLTSLSAPEPISPPPLNPSLPQPPLSLPHVDALSLSQSLQPPTAPPPLLTESIPPVTPPLLLTPPRVFEAQKIPMMHNMTDEDLVKRVMEVSRMTNLTDYKVAFMFLTPGPLPLSPLWELFFQGHENLFSIYVHPHPSYIDSIPQDSVFYGTRITSQPVYWGDITMIDAERRLLANALLDPSNQRFVLLSDSCIPLFNFTTTYNYLVNSNLSYIASFDDKRKSGRGRYNPQMAPNITIQDWRKGSQWFEVNHDLALAIVAEQNYYRLFKEYCHPPCYNDEHYLPTLVNILYGRLNSNRTITHVDWSIVGPHPRKFGGGEITEELLNSIRFGSTDCIYNDNTTPMCVLFARKFTPGTLNPLLTFASLLFGTNN